MVLAAHRRSVSAELRKILSGFYRLTYLVSIEKYPTFHHMSRPEIFELMRYCSAPQMPFFANVIYVSYLVRVLRRCFGSLSSKYFKEYYCHCKC